MWYFLSFYILHLCKNLFNLRCRLFVIRICTEFMQMLSFNNTYVLNSRVGHLLVFSRVQLSAKRDMLLLFLFSHAWLESHSILGLAGCTPVWGCGLQMTHLATPLIQNADGWHVWKYVKVGCWPSPGNMDSSPIFPRLPNSYQQYL